MIQFTAADGQAQNSTTLSGSMSYVEREAKKREIQSILYTTYINSPIVRVFCNALIPGLVNESDKNRILTHLWQWSAYIFNTFFMLIPWPDSIVKYAEIVGVRENQTTFADLVNRQIAEFDSP